jgi:hypothetical protein
MSAGGLRCYNPQGVRYVPAGWSLDTLAESEGRKARSVLTSRPKGGAPG